MKPAFAAALTPLLALGLAAGGWAGSAAAERPDHTDAGIAQRAVSTATPLTDFEMPFPCGQSWTGTTRSGHSPSTSSIDWNRPGDEGDAVVASAPGEVVRAERTSSGYGHWVMVEHATGERTIYAHLDEVAVALGQVVDQGAVLGTVGETGNAYGAHLHFEERTAGGSVLTPWFHGSQFAFGSTAVSQNCPDVPLAGNFLRGPEAELVVFRRGERGTFVIERPGREPRELRFGRSSDQPVVGDWDGNGRVNPGVRKSGTTVFRLRAAGEVTRIRFGEVGDLPVAGDWDGDGRSEVGVRRPASADFVLRAGDGTFTTIVLGDADDLPVTGDWDGDGRTDLGVYDQASSTFTLRLVDGSGLTWTTQLPFGQPGDLPVAGDWDGDQITEIGVWSPETATFSERRAASPTAARITTRTTVFGRPR